MATVAVEGLPEPAAEPVRCALEERATMDVTVAGAGEMRAAPFLGLTQDDWASLVSGVKGAFQLAQETARSLTDRGAPGRIILVSSTAAVRPVHGATLAAAAGAFLTTLAQVAAVELGPEGITVNVVAPGFVGDGRFDDAVPVGRAAEPRDLVEVCAFLASEDAAYVTGAVVTVDGGFSITKSPGGSPLLR